MFFVISVAELYVLKTVCPSSLRGGLKSTGANFMGSNPTVVMHLTFFLQNSNLQNYLSVGNVWFG